MDIIDILNGTEPLFSHHFGTPKEIGFEMSPSSRGISRLRRLFRPYLRKTKILQIYLYNDAT